MTTHALVSRYFTTTAGTKLHYIQAGSVTGLVLVCLHGLGASTDTFVSLLPHLSPTYNVILVDFQGFGKSPLTRSPNTISIAGHVADLGDLIVSLQEPSSASRSRQVVIIGHSLGAIIALQYAAQYPEAVGGLALLAVGRAAGHIPAARQRMRDLANAVRTKGIAFAAEVATKSNFYEETPERMVDPSAQGAVKNAVLTSNPEAYARTCEAIVDPEHKDPHYEKIIAPAVFIVGDRDVLSPVERSWELSELVGGTSWVEVVKSGHQPILEDVPGVRMAIDKLLGTLAV